MFLGVSAVWLQDGAEDVSAASLATNVVKYYYPSAHSGQAVGGQRA